MVLELELLGKLKSSSESLELKFASSAFRYCCNLLLFLIVSVLLSLLRNF